MRGAESLPRHVARDVLAAVEAGRAMDRADQRLPPRHDDDASLDAAVGLLTAWVGQVAASEEVEPRLLATRDDLKALVNKRPTRLDDGWRAEMVGDRLRALLAGDAVLRLIDGGRGVALEPSPDGARARE
jgi:ribonuclease D